MSWPLEPLESIAEIISGYAFKSTWFDDGQDKVIRISDFDDGIVDLSNAKTVDAKRNKVSDQFVAREGDILMALSGATTGKIGVVNSYVAGAYVNQRVAIIRAKAADSRNYIRYLFSGQRLSSLLMTAGGAAQANLSPKTLKNLEVPVPPLAEQNRIAAILDKADQLRQKRQQAISLADDFLRSVFLDMFGDPVTNPKKYRKGTIRDLLIDAKYGTSIKASETEGKYPILRMGNITYAGGWNLSDLKYVNLSEKDEPKYLARNGDLVFNRTNSRELVGKTAVYDFAQPMALAGYLIRARVNEQGNPYYISAYLNSDHGKKTLLNMCKSIVGMANINAQEMQDIPILIPPIEHQRDYEKLVHAVQKMLKVSETASSMSEDLFYSLSQKVFQGSLEEC